MKQLLLFFFFCWSASCFAQSSKEPVILNFDDYAIDDQITVPFKTIKVIDARFDKSNVGSISETLRLNGIKLERTPANFPESLASYLPKLFTKILAFDDHNNDTLILLVKQFRLSDYNSLMMSASSDPRLLLKISASFYRLRNEEMTKLFSVDNLFSKKLSSENVMMQGQMNHFRARALLSVLQSILYQKNWQTTGSSFHSSTVEEGIQKRFQLPLFTETDQKIGVYVNFQELKLNRPSVTNVRFITRNNLVVRIEDSTGKELELTRFWGAYDGKRRFIFFRKDLCELTPVDKSFRFISRWQTSDLTGDASYGNYASHYGLVGGALMKSAKNTSWNQFFYLNMDEEEIYLEEVFGKSSLKNMQKDLLK
ncbi:MAG: hypothetical protein EON98_12835 [Chitinophagaceae bacterium]|nr:MAG: hypothetical protein EON98_12835 [Chitinophagaceae bacterium]